MKIKTNFVTNSSSSSFVICIKDDMTQEELMEHLLSTAKEFVTNVDDVDELEWSDFEDNESLISAKDVARKVSKSLLEDKKLGIKLDDWWVFGGTCSNEDNYGVELFIYEYGIKNSDRIKYKTFDA